MEQLMVSPLSRWGLMLGKLTPYLCISMMMVVGAVLPATYYIELQRAIVLRGASLGDFWVNIVILAGMNLAVIILCALQFKRKIA
jgi:ABC-type multidrug transport system permease subunit